MQPYVVYDPVTRSSGTLAGQGGKHYVELERGVEPLTPSLRVMCSTN